MENPNDYVSKSIAIRGGHIPAKLPTYLKLDKSLFFETKYEKDSTNLASDKLHDHDLLMIKAAGCLIPSFVSWRALYI